MSRPICINCGNDLGYNSDDCGICAAADHGAASRQAEIDALKTQLVEASDRIVSQTKEIDSLKSELASANEDILFYLNSGLGKEMVRQQERADRAEARAEEHAKMRQEYAEQACVIMSERDALKKQLADSRQAFHVAVREALQCADRAERAEAALAVAVEALSGLRYTHVASDALAAIEAVSSSSMTAVEAAALEPVPHAPDCGGWSRGFHGYYMTGPCTCGALRESLARIEALKKGGAT
jgi:hypothetical protein